MRSFLIRGVSALAIVAALASTNRAMADVTLNTTSANLPNYSTNYYTNATIAGFTSDAAVTAFMTANGGTLASFTAATGAPAVGPYSSVIVTAPSGFPIPPWMANGPSSSWYGPTTNGASTAALAPFVNTGAGFSPSTSSPQGFFAYTINFGLAGLPAIMSGLKWSSDNQGVAIYLNGKNEGDTAPGDFTAFTPFSLNPGDFNVGANSLTFVVFNEEYKPPHFSPTGIRIEGSIVATAVPEPATVAMAVSVVPMLLIGAWVHRRRSTVRPDETASL